jgi:hypothetical protein
MRAMQIDVGPKARTVSEKEGREWATARRFELSVIFFFVF